MRMQMERFNKTFGILIAVVLSRGQDAEKIATYKEQALPVYEAMCTAANGKFLMGTDDITQLDIHVGPFWEIMYLFRDGVYSDVNEKLKIEETAPNFFAYVQRFREHPAIKPYRFSRKASEAHGVRSRAWDPNEKCQLSLAVLEGDALPPDAADN